ncbi:hypothetical protein [Streptosporangium saharense]|uniref:Uncharacterized protein n=1 Tax=Streptosporangium saharense TaxID=1706840 RepID=A0A7W7QT23_9ACTN|nr:hypothetical protein [Streptosporangium saharense]MBB4919252.1 hypothetical protein [Streptosporangium saharense]
MDPDSEIALTPISQVQRFTPTADQAFDVLSRDRVDKDYEHTT